MKYFSKDPHKIIYRMEATPLFSCVISRGVLKVIGVILMTVEHCQSKRLCLQTSNPWNPPILFIWINPIQRMTIIWIRINTLHINFKHIDALITCMKKKNSVKHSHLHTLLNSLTFFWLLTWVDVCAESPSLVWELPACFSANKVTGKRRCLGKMHHTHPVIYPFFSWCRLCGFVHLFICATEASVWRLHKPMFS